MAEFPTGCVCGYQPLVERLREDVNRWRRICEMFAESDPKFEAFLEYFTAVRDDR